MTRSGTIRTCAIAVVSIAAIWAGIRSAGDPSDRPSAPDGTAGADVGPTAAASDATRVAIGSSTPDRGALAVESEDAPTRRPEPRPTAAVRISVSDVDGQPIDAATARVAELSDLPQPGADPHSCVATVDRALVARGTTDATGAVGFDLAAGTHLVQVACDGYQPAARVIDAPLSTASRFVLQPETGFHGRVIHGVTKAPIADALVTAVPRVRHGDVESPGEFLERVAVGESIRTTADGAFAMRRVTGEKLVVRCEASGFPPRESMLVPTGQEVTIELSGSVVATGIVVDELGAPIAGAKLDCTLRGVIPGVYAGRTTSALDGTFRFDTIPSGDICVSTFKDGFAFAKVRRTVKDGEELFVEVTMIPEAPLEGIVVDDVGAAVPGATVHTYDRTQSAEVSYSVTADDGTWWASWIHPHNPLDLIVEKDGYETLDLHGIPLDNKPKRLVLPKRGAIAGRVVDPSGRPVTRFAVRAIPFDIDRKLERDVRWDLERTRFESADGSFTIPRTRVARYELTVEAPGFARRQVVVEDVPRGGSTVGPILVELAPGASISGRVVDEHMAPRAGVPVALAQHGFEGAALAAETDCAAATDEAGSFELRDLPRATFDLVVGDERLGMRLYPDLRPEDFPRDLVLESPGGLSGRALTPWRSPATVLVVHVTRLGEWLGSRLDVQPDGSFAADRLAPGTWEVCVDDYWGANEYGGECTASAVVEVRSGETTQVVVDLSNRGRVFGRVDCDPSLLDSFRLRVVVSSADDGRCIGVVPVLSDSTFTLAGLAPGAYAALLGSDLPGLLVDARGGFRIDSSAGEAECRLHVPSNLLHGIVQGMPDGVAGEIRFVAVADGSESARVLTRPDGRYAAQLGRDGIVAILVRAPGCADDASTRIAAPLSANPEPLTHRLVPEARLGIEVVDDLERPVPGAAVELSLRGRPPFLPRLEGTTDAAGTLWLTRLAAGPGTVSVRRAGYVPVGDVSVHLDAGAMRVVTVRMARTALLVASLSSSVPSIGSPHRLTLEPLDRPGESPDSKPLAPGEHARFDQLPPGRYRLAAADLKPIEVELHPGETRAVELSAR